MSQPQVAFLMILHTATSAALLRIRAYVALEKGSLVQRSQSISHCAPMGLLTADRLQAALCIGKF